MDWVEIPEFPDYAVDNRGRVFNLVRQRQMSLSQNSHGVVQVGLVKNGLQYKRGVALLVAKAFLPPPTPPSFNTPINLDGDRTNNTVENLTWRPRWFAVCYHRQFLNNEPVSPSPIQELRTGEIYKDAWHAATTFGLLVRDIKQAMINRTYVWPTYQRFKEME